MTRRQIGRVAVVLVLAAGLVGGIVFVIRAQLMRPTSITAHFSNATGIYPGDDVRIAGVRVGSIESIEPEGDRVKIVLTVDHGVPIPADAKALIVAQNLLAARFVQLTPAYEGHGPTMRTGADIGVERTSAPIEWDEVKTQLMRLATDLGPSGGMSTTSLSRFIDGAATAMGGNGAKFRQTLAELSRIARVIADGGGDVVAARRWSNSRIGSRACPRCSATPRVI
jgi:phospholipid/cholesterol/gamma-HCH transport system substrate-binding protein